MAVFVHCTIVVNMLWSIKNGNYTITATSQTGYKVIPMLVADYIVSP